MAEQVIFGKTDKRLNSISQLYTPIITTNVLLKEPCSIAAPTFLVKQPYATMRECNYCEYAGYYYFITNVVSVRSKHVLVQCARDPLASFRDDILRHVIYANYADKANWDNKLDDLRMTTDMTQNSAVRSLIVDFTGTEIGSNIPLFDDEGTIILSSYVSDKGFVQWAITLDAFAELIEKVYKSILEEIDDAGLTSYDAWQKFAIKYFGSSSINDAILSAIWVPFSLELFQGEFTEILLGTYVTDVGGLALKKVLDVEIRQTTAILPGAMDAVLAKHAWLRHPTYTTVQLLHPNGVSDISCPEMVKNPVYKLTLAITKTTGDYVINVSCTPNPDKEFTVTTVTGNISYDLTHWLTTKGLNIGDVGVNIVKWGAQSIAGIYGAFHGSVSTTSFTDNSITETLKEGDDYLRTRQGNGSVTTKTSTSSSSAQLASGISGMLPSARPHTTSGNIQCTPNILLAYRDGDTNLNDAFRINVESAFPRIIYEDETTGTTTSYDNFCLLNGYPCKKMVALSSLEPCLVQGFCASIGAEGATTTELSTINSVLNSGMYIEE